MTVPALLVTATPPVAFASVDRTPRVNAGLGLANATIARVSGTTLERAHMSRMSPTHRTRPRVAMTIIPGP